MAAVAGTMHRAEEFHEGVVNLVSAVRVGFAALRTATNVVRVLQQGNRVFFGVSQFCGSCRDRRRCSRVGRSAHGVSGLSGEVGRVRSHFCFQPTFFQQFLFSLSVLSQKKAMRSWGISSPPDLSRWFRDQGFNDSARQPHPSTGARILDRGGVHVRFSSGSVLRSTHVGQQMAVPPDSVPVGVTRQVDR